MFANFICINEVVKMFSTAFANQANLIEYYKNIAGERIFDIVQEGSDYMMNAELIQDEK
jgi:hypothetical protein